MRRFSRVAACVVVLSLSGCASMRQAQQNNEIDQFLAGGDYKGAAMAAEGRLGLKPDEAGTLPAVTATQGSVLHHMEAAEAWRMAGDLDRSLAHYDMAEEALQAVELQNQAGAAGKQVSAALLNDSFLDYKPSPAEAVLVNYNKAVTFWSQGKRDLARVEFNRAEDRIRRAVERYEKEIAKAQEEAEGKPAGDDQTLTRIESAMGISAWAPYENFVVPQATYLHALFLAAGDSSDKTLALELMGRVQGINPENQVVGSDLGELKLGQLCPTRDCVWILSDEGMGPVLQERRLDIPVVTFSGLVTVSFALPELVSRQTAPTNYVELRSGNNSVSAYAVGDMDRVVQSEFKKRLPATVTRAVVGATARAIAQHQLNKQNAIAGLLGNLANLAITSADIRSWRAIPGTTRVARVRRNGESLTLASGGWSQNLSLPDGNHIVYVRQPMAGGTPLVHVLSL